MTVVAIDGPAGAGKSTVARRVAESLGFDYLDTGAMYRAIALAALEGGIDATDGPALGELAASSGIEATDRGVWLNGRDVTDRIRAADVTELVSVVAAHPEVRTALVAQQRQAAATTDVVMEGRDIGSAVVPDAEVKIFLTASLEERARRRWEESGGAEDLASIRASIADRDAADAGRATSPLVKAQGAVEVDTTGLSIDEVVAAIVAIAQGAPHA